MPARKASTASAEKKTKAPRKPKAALTTRENLSALIGTARQILRKDKGLNGDVDRLPLLTWVMFLKFLDDLEVVHEEVWKANAALLPATLERIFQSEATT